MNDYHYTGVDALDLSDVTGASAKPSGYAAGPLRKQMLTDVEVADHLSVSISTVRRWRLKGGGPRWIRIGSSIRYDSADLRAYILGLPGGGGAN